jgi:hypothetical protein
LREVLTLAPLCILMLWIVLMPGIFIAPSQRALADLLAQYRTRTAAPAPATPTLRGIESTAGFAPAAAVRRAGAGGGR